MSSSGPVDFDTALERPCDLLSADKAAELGWGLPGREVILGNAPSFDHRRLQSTFGANDITISGRPALLSRIMNSRVFVFVDLGGGRGLKASIEAADEPQPSDATVAAAEALAVAVLENVSDA